MEKFYFTFGSEGQPFCGGWVKVIAEDYEQACAIFRSVYPDDENGLLNCSDVYPEKYFRETMMYKRGQSFGYGCHGTISLKIKKNDR